MEPKTILVTNDDGTESPTLVPLLTELARHSWCKAVRPVIPATEQSWIADAITRFRPLKAQPHTFGSHTGFTVDGTPADCAQIGIHNLYTDQPSAVVSGINMGTNAGLPFFLSSGTVGGATSAFLAGMPAIALSVHAPPDVFHLWRTHDSKKLSSFKKEWHDLSAICVQIIFKLLQADAWQHADIFSVNLPWQANQQTPVRLTQLENKRFRSLFVSNPDGTFQHSMGDFSNAWVKDRSNGSYEPDFKTVEAGMISITPIRYHFSPEPAETNYLKTIFTTTDTYSS